ncbi:MAG: hypothetical protein ACK45X_09175, partial [Roseiflexaceae bacterium]
QNENGVLSFPPQAFRPGSDIVGVSISTINSVLSYRSGVNRVFGSTMHNIMVSRTPTRTPLITLTASDTALPTETYTPSYTKTPSSTRTPSRTRTP